MNLKHSITKIFIGILCSISLAYAQTLDAGRTTGALDVSPTGAATYSVPIAVPPGINGVMPQIALTYNSQSGNGIAGYGWNISGLSSITRIPRTKFHDDVVGGVNVDLNDRYALDGQRLILKSGTYGAEGAFYVTENYSNITVVSHGATGNGPSYFDVYYPDGSQAVYGYDSNTRTATNWGLHHIDNPLGIRITYSYTNANNALNISSISYGAKGLNTPLNFIHFNYKTRQRKEQSYSGGQSIYLDKILDNIRVVGNGIDYRHYKLTYNVSPVLNYERLTQVQEISGDQTKAFAPIIFNYNNTDPNPFLGPNSNAGLSGITSNNNQVLTSDINGNGKMDLVLYDLQKNKLWVYWDPKSGSSYNPSTDMVSTAVFKDIFSVSTLTSDNKLKNGQGVLLVREENSTTVKFQTYGKGTTSALSMMYERDWNNAPKKPDYFSECVGYTIEGEAIPKKYLSGDFNGDGLTDVIAINEGYYYNTYEYYHHGSDPNCELTREYEANSTAYFINLDKRVTTNFVHNAGNLLTTHDVTNKLYVGDFNGDGKSDILQIEYGGLRVYQLDENNNIDELWSMSDSRIRPYETLLGDYNGDGKTDLLLAINPSTTQDFLVLISSGTGFYNIQSDYPFEPSWGGWASNGTFLSQTTIIPNDINNDGKTDIIKFVTNANNNNSTATRVQLYIYNNMGPSSNSSPEPIFSGGEVFNNQGVHVKEYSIPLFLSSDNPNFNLEIALISDNTITSFINPKDNRQETEIVSVNHDGILQNINYQPLLPSSATSGIPVYNGLSNLTFPYINIWGTPGLNVVSKLRRNFDNKEVSQSFGYRRGVSHAEGFGFIGFEKTIRSSWYQTEGEPGIIYTVNVNDPQNRGAVLRTFTTKDKDLDTKPISDIQGTTPDLVYSSPITGVQTITASNSVTLLPGTTINGTSGNVVVNISDPASGIADGGDISKYITRTDYTYKTLLQPNKVFVNVPESITTKNNLEGTNTLVLNKYDSYYNITEQTSNFSGIGTTTSINTYANNPTAVYIGRLTNKKTIAQNSGDTYSTEEQYTYTGYTPTQIKRKGNGTPFITEDLTYDTYGNVTGKTLVTANGSRTELFQYDPSGRFVVKKTDVEGLESNITYNTSNGNINTQTNAYGQITSFNYDAWGRPTQVTDFLGSYSTTNYQRSGSDIIVTQADNQGHEKKITTNAVGKEILVTEKDVLGQIIHVQHAYDEYDRKIAVSEPGVGYASSLKTETTFDDYGRLATIKMPTGKIATYGYPSPMAISVNDGTKTVTTTKNALGYVISTQDPGGTINNTYFANGNLKSAQYNGSTQTIQQDGWGRKTQLVDPSAGTYSYTYNQFGEVLTETTPKGTTTYTYEASTGKISTKRIQGSDNPTDMLYQYTYDATTKLPTVTTLANADGNNTTYTYTYDTHKRPATITEDNLHAVFTKTLTYDSYSRVSTEKSDAKNKANNVTVSKTILNTYQNGELKKITDNSNGIDIWSVTSLNARGQVTTAQLGNNLKETNQYDQYGFPGEIKTERIQPSVTELMKLTYSFDVQRGNLNSRANTAFGWNESFTYDNLDRLTGFTDNNGTQTQSYDGPGRITTNSEIGSYNYTGSSYKLNKVTNLTTFANTHFQANSPQLVTYNAFKSPVQISVHNKEIISFQYNGAQQRSHMYYGGTQTNTENRPFRRHYSEDGSMEITEDIASGKTSFVFYLGGDAYDAPAIWKHEQTSGGTTVGLYYLHRDYQGSILMITDITGTVKEKRQFDAWGNIVKLTDGIGTNLTAFVILDRGYTGHEHLLGVGLIHMNGRLYDPLIHRFLGPDNFVQDATNTQSFNRYAYVMNNPLKYTDKSGEFWEFIIGAAVSVFTNGLSNHFAGKDFFDGWAKAAIFGAAQGGAANLIGNVAKAWHLHGLGGDAFQAVAHGTLGGVMSVANGGGFGPGFLSGFASSLVGSALKGPLGDLKKGWANAGMYGSGMLSGGLSSVAAGGNFWDGVRNGAITTGLNHWAHMLNEPKTTVAGIYGAGGEGVSGNPDLRKLVEDQGGQMFQSSVGGEDVSIINYLSAAYRKGHILKLYGHSRGGAAAIRIANWLGRLGVHISEITLYDPVAMYWEGSLQLYHDNVGKVTNYYQRNPIDGILKWAKNPFIGSPVSQNLNTNIIIRNVNLTGSYYQGVLINHLNITEYAIRNP